MILAALVAASLPGFSQNLIAPDAGPALPRAETVATRQETKEQVELHFNVKAPRYRYGARIVSSLLIPVIESRSHTSPSWPWHAGQKRRNDPGSVLPYFRGSVLPLCSSGLLR